MLASLSKTHIPYNGNALAASGTIHVHSKLHPLHCVAVILYGITDNIIVKIFVRIYKYV